MDNYSIVRFVIAGDINARFYETLNILYCSVKCSWLKNTQSTYCCVLTAIMVTRTRYSITFRIAYLI
jgi:hypothetical protein